MRSSYILFLGLLLLACHVNGQYTPSKLPRVSGAVAPSADVSALSRINEVPVNFYTGIPQISYPVYDFNYGALKLSVALNYFAGGSKVEEMATNTGLGWTLQAGGIIARTVRSMPDDYPVNGFMYAAVTPTAPGNLLDSFYHDKIDAQLDVFQFSFNNYVGKFYLGKNNNIIVVPDSRIKVKANIATMPDAPASTISSFTIVTEDGTTYLFTERELSRISDYNDASPYINKNYVSAWFLTRIIAPFRTDSIQLTYDSRSLYYTSRNPEVTVTDPLASNRILQNNTKYTDVYLQSKRLSRIDLPDNNFLKFIYDTKTRCDFGSEQALRYIEVRDTGLRRGVRLDYQYSTPGGFISYRQPCSGNEKEKRLILKQLTEYTREGEKPPIIYDYEKDVMLPSRDSRSLDFWGYYNGKENSTLVPPFRDMTGADRNPDFHYMRAGSLRKILHPSGGYTLLEYENNEHFTIDKDQRSMPYYYGSNDTWININKLFSKQTGITWKFDSDADRDYFRSLSRGTINIKITTEDRTKVLFEQINFAQNIANSDRYIVLDLPYNGNFIIQLTYSNFQQEDMDRLNFRFIWNNDIVKDDKKPTGGLRIKRQTSYDGISHSSDIVTEYRYTNEAGKSSGYNIETPVYYYRTGVTADKFYPADIRMSEPFNGLTYTQGSTSGYGRVEVINGTPERNTGRTVYEFSSFKDLMDGESIPWFYQNYTDVTQFPYVPKDKAEWALGLPLVTTFYGPDGRLINKSINYYDITRNNYVNSYFRCVKVGVDREIIQNNVRSNNYVYNDYYPVQGRALLTSTMAITYYQNGSSSSNETTYEYDNTNLTLRRTTTDYDKSAGQKMVKTFYYPYDYTLTGAIGTLKSNNIILPIATEVWLQGNGVNRLFSYEATDYQVLGGSVVRPAKSYSLFTTKPLEASQVPAFNPASLTRMPSIKATTAYESYNQKWNVSQIHNLQNGAVSSIIFDDVTQVILAKVSNATMSEIAYTSFESTTKGKWSYAGIPNAGVQAATGKNSYLLNTGSITSAALPTGKIYTLSFWARDGAANVAGGTLLWSEPNTATGWTLYRYKVNGGATLTISGTARIDELRLHPEYATMETTCYEPIIGAITFCDANDKITWNEYDGLNRMKAIRDQDRNIVKWNDYTMILPPYKNDPLSNTFTRSCYLGEGSSVTYSIPTGKYTSYISLADANDQAQEDMRINGQQYANTNGTCTWYNEIRAGIYAKQCTGGNIGSNVTYSVPARKYTSNISLDDANAKAQKEITDYGQIKANTEGTCMPSLLYITFSSKNHTSNTTTDRWSYLTTRKQDLVINFYTDAACTIPYSVTNYNVEIKTTVNQQEYIDGNNYSNTYSSAQTYSCSGASFVIPNITEEEYRKYRKYEGNMEVPSDDYAQYDYTYSIVPNTRYIVK